MFRKLPIIFTFFMFCFAFGQQNEEFKYVKNYFDYHRFMLNTQFQKKIDKEKNTAGKINLSKDFGEFMKKMDSVQNTAFVNALIKVKNREDLFNLNEYQNQKNFDENPKKSELSEEARYPGGFENLRSQVADLFYFDSVITQIKTLSANVEFVVERDGSISGVHAQGDNSAFNRQAEIAMYQLPEKFSPALVDGSAVRYRFRLPLKMNFE